MAFCSKYDSLSAQELAVLKFGDIFKDPEATSEDVAKMLNAKMNSLFNLELESEDLEEALIDYSAYDLSALAGEDYAEVETTEGAEDVFFQKLNAAFEVALEQIKADYVQNGESALDSFYQTYEELLNAFTAFKINYYLNQAGQNVNLRPNAQKLQKLNTDNFNKIKEVLESFKSEGAEKYNAFVAWINSTYNVKQKEFHSRVLNQVNKEYFEYINERLNFNLLINNYVIELVKDVLPTANLEDNDVFRGFVVKVINAASYYYNQASEETDEETGALIDEVAKSNLGNTFNVLMNAGKSAKKAIANGDQSIQQYKMVEVAQLAGMRVLNFLKEFESDDFFTTTLSMYIKLFVSRAGNDNAADAYNQVYTAKPELLNMDNEEQDEMTGLKRNLDLLMLSQGQIAIKKENVENIADIFQALNQQNPGYLSRSGLFDMNLLISTDLVEVADNIEYYVQFQNYVLTLNTPDYELNEENFVDVFDQFINERIEEYTSEQDEDKMKNAFIMKIVNWIRGVQEDSLFHNEQITFPALLEASVMSILEGEEYKTLKQILTNILIKYNNEQQIQQKADNNGVFALFNEGTLNRDLMTGLISYTVTRVEGAGTSLNFGHGQKPINMQFNTIQLGGDKNVQKIKDRKNEPKDIDEMSGSNNSPRFDNRNKKDKKKRNGTLSEEDSEEDKLRSPKQNVLDMGYEDSPNRIDPAMNNLEDNQGKNIVNVIKGEVTTGEYEYLQKADLINRIKKGEKVPGNDKVEIIYVQIVEAGSDCYDQILQMQKNQSLNQME